jgi:hypothetical protein
MTVIVESLSEEKNYIVDKMLEFNNNQAQRCTEVIEICQ